jgi:hypothetical protein
MLRESSSSTATTFCWLTACPDDQRGTEQTEEDQRESRDAEGRQDDAVAQTSIDDLHSTVGEDRGGDYNADHKRGDE